MSNYYFYPDKTPEWRYQRFDATTTLALWTPRTGNKFVLTGLHITNNAAAGTFAIFLGTTDAGPNKVAQFTLAASSSIAPVFGPIDGSGANYILYGRPASSPTSGFHVTSTGFEDTL